MSYMGRAGGGAAAATTVGARRSLATGFRPCMIRILEDGGKSGKRPLYAWRPCFSPDALFHADDGRREIVGCRILLGLRPAETRWATALSLIQC
ncbi:hypothetical protein VTK73DRAFT_2733 [Phialemonium thermophilum]|uniref:Uncharacterized protein n=1 Tax=Phialemonium thermophilum TaxID=223376 RepID=A0ABR3VPC0_9PEZI